MCCHPVILVGTLGEVRIQDPKIILKVALEMREFRHMVPNNHPILELTQWVPWLHGGVPSTHKHQPWLDITHWVHWVGGVGGCSHCTLTTPPTWYYPLSTLGWFGWGLTLHRHHPPHFRSHIEHIVLVGGGVLKLHIDTTLLDITYWAHWVGGGGGCSHYM